MRTIAQQGQGESALLVAQPCSQMHTDAPFSPCDAGNATKLARGSRLLAGRRRDLRDLAPGNATFRELCCQIQRPLGLPTRFSLVVY